MTDPKIFKSIGLMSGTSMDGVDATLIETDGEKIINPLYNVTIEYDPNFKLELREAEKIVVSAKRNIASEKTIQKSTNYHADAVHKLIKKAGISSKDVDLIGYHGQSLYHNPRQKISIQIGDGQLLSNLSSIPVVNDFRIQDVLNGGQGAPLAPIYHRALVIKNNLLPAAFVNCGGIANISIILGEQEDDVIGYDTGPGNALIDRYIRIKTNNTEFMDKDGQYGRKGNICDEVFTELTSSFSSYLTMSYPKSLDPSDLVLPSKIFNLSIYDACATLEKFTAFCVVNNIPDNFLPLNWILVGGGWNNPVILKHIKEYLYSKSRRIKLLNADQIGSNSTYIEAEIFAFLAVRSVRQLPISLPSVTGVNFPCKGGTLYLPR